MNLKILEELRTKEEVLNYFKQLGKKITDEELNALKQSYEQAEENNEALTLQQLDDVAGGLELIKIERSAFEKGYKACKNKHDKLTIDDFINTFGLHMIYESKLNDVITIDMGKENGILLLVNDGKKEISQRKVESVNLKDNGTYTLSIKCAGNKVQKIELKDNESFLQFLRDHKPISQIDEGNNIIYTFNRRGQELRKESFDAKNSRHLIFDKNAFLDEKNQCLIKLGMRIAKGFKSGATIQGLSNFMILLGKNISDISNVSVHRETSEPPSQVAEVVVPKQQIHPPSAALTTVDFVVPRVQQGADSAVIPGTLVEPIQPVADKDQNSVPQVEQHKGNLRPEVGTGEGQQISGMDSPLVQPAQPVLASEQQPPGNPLIPTAGGMGTKVQELASSQDPSYKEQRKLESSMPILDSSPEPKPETAPLMSTGSTQEGQSTTEKPQKASMSSDRKVKLAAFCLTYGIVVSLTLLAVGLTEGQNIYDLIKGNKKVRK